MELSDMITICSKITDHIIEEIGCKFRHEPSSFCKFKNCDNSLCQFQPKNDHEAEEASVKEVDDRYIEVEVDSSTKCNECDQQCYTLETLKNHIKCKHKSERL